MRVKHLYAYCAFLFFCSTPCILFGSTRGAETQLDVAASSGPFFYGLAAFFYVWSTVSLLRRPTRLRRALSVPLIAFALLWALTSAMWSVQPTTTLVKSVALIGTTIVAIDISQSMPLASSLRAVTFAYVTLLLVSLLLLFAAPASALTDGKLHGIYAHKNSLGWSCAMCMGVAVAARGCGALSRGAFVAISAIALFAALLAQSATGLLALVATLPAYYSLRAYAYAGKLRMLWWAFAICAVVLGAVLNDMLFDLVTAAMGKSGTLSGRSILWVALWKAIAARPFLGWGFSAFWNSQYAQTYLAYAFFVTDAQGGYVELLLTMGLIGGLLYLFFYFRAFAQLFHASKNRDLEATSLCTVLVCISILAVSAPVLISVNQAYWQVIAIVVSQRVASRSGVLESADVAV